MGWVLWVLGIATPIALAVWAFWEPIMKVTKSWLETVKAYREAREAKAHTKKAELELEEVKARIQKRDEEQRNEQLLQEAKEKQTQQHPRGNVIFPELWYRENFKRLSEGEMESFIWFLRKKGKL